MIGHFPEPYPDELFYSLCARFSDRMRFPSRMAVIRDLFDRKCLRVSVDLPSYLDTFVAALPPGHHYTVDRLIDDHTLLPFCAPFLSPSRLALLRANMHGNNGAATRRHVGGVLGSITTPEFLRFCPLCAEADTKQFGERYWHRIHQVPGVEICPGHLVWLEQSEARVKYRRNSGEFVSAERAILTRSPRPMDASDSSHAALVQIAQDSDWLLGQHGLTAGFEPLQQRYVTLLIERGLASYTGTVRDQRLIRAFVEHYPQDFLVRLGCELDPTNRYNWLTCLVQETPYAQHPLHHLLLMQFLRCTAEAFFNLPVERHPFGEGPWPCLNPGSDHYRQPVIRECQITYAGEAGKPPIGQFVCECGFAYRRRGPDQSPEDRFRYGRVKSFGPVWKEALRALWENPSISLEQAAHQLGVIPNTVKRYAALMGLSFPRPARGGIAVRAPVLRPPKDPGRRLAIRDQYRATWLSLLERHPEASVNMLRRMEPRAHMWLYRHDADWLAAHAPQSKTRKHKGHTSYSPVYWQKRDVQLAEAVKAAAARLKNTAGPPIQVTVTGVAREIGKATLIKTQLSRLPLTAEALAQVAETREDFAVRRIEWATESYRQEHICPTRTEFVRRAGVTHQRTAEFPRVKEAVEAALQMLNEDEGCGCFDPGQFG
jgi:hypothetical protein